MEGQIDQQLVEELTQSEPPDELCRWALRRIAAPEPRVRRFAAEIVHEFSYDLRPLREEVKRALLPRLSAEEDPATLLAVTTAFAEYHHPDSRARPELHGLARHSDAAVRAEVAERIDDLDLLSSLASDPVGAVRAAALAQIFRTDLGTPAARAAYAAHRDDGDDDARMRALAGLAKFGDDAAQERLLAMTGGRDDVQAYWLYDEVVRYRRLTHLARVAAININNVS